MNPSFVQIPLTSLKEISSTLFPLDVLEIENSGYLLQFKDSSLITRLDPELKEIWRKDFGVYIPGNESCKMTVSPDGLLIGLICNHEFKIIDLNGNSVYELKLNGLTPYQEADCYFSDDNKLIWLVSPDLENGDEVYAFDRNDFSILASKRITAKEEYIYSFSATPQDDAVILDAAAGQDEGQLFLLRIEDGKIELEELEQCNDRIMGSFAPNGNEFVTAPHYDEGIEIFSFPAIRKIASVEQEAIFDGREEYPSEEDEDSLNYLVFYLNNKYLVVFTRYHRLLLIERETMRCIGELLPEGCQVNAYNKSGKLTTNPAEIFDYEGEILDVKLTQSHELLIKHTSGSIKWYDLPDWLS